MGAPALLRGDANRRICYSLPSVTTYRKLASSSPILSISRTRHVCQLAMRILWLGDPKKMSDFQPLGDLAQCGIIGSPWPVLAVLCETRPNTGSLSEPHASLPLPGFR